MTISKVEFKFQHFNASNNFKINPSFALIDLGNKQQQSLLFLFDCIFDSAPGITENNIIQVHIQNAAIAYFDNCTFNGIGKNQYTNITMIDVLLCQNISFQLCKFQNTAISRQLEAVHIYSFIENASISIIDCQFTNITSSYPKQSAALGIYAYDNLSVQITWTNFTNCSALNSEVGAIFVSNFFEEHMISYFQITNNIFRNNYGINAGSIFCNIIYLNEKLNFSSNTLISNMNNQTKQIGKDAQLTFYEPPIDWSQSSTAEMIVDWFNGSTSDAKKDSVYFQAYRNKVMFMSGSITLQHPPNWGKLSTHSLIGIIVGSVVIVASIVIIIIFVVLWYNKKKQYQQTSNFESSRLILRTSYRSI
ncbi:MAG: hypothetical protein EZS28_007798 [Streblomastix strix]|uniref:Right handed beta helix domain-containing protein n=1 Tax=Streblomastix strix TaxID=222440 RepID=A0A5J4WQH9_9EUKA|nr:MAG: hypothetical protein EZS28_007798 [Streblomastix strix]